MDTTPLPYVRISSELGKFKTAYTHGTIANLAITPEASTWNTIHDNVQSSRLLSAC